ncbi:MAG TPA: hypothetical protein VF384_18400 [Planctomycetota bacterium]
MVSCREFLDLFLDDWLAGELPARRWRDCDAHLDRCRKCSEYVASYRTTVRLIQASARAEPTGDLPEDLVQEILRSLRA